MNPCHNSDSIKKEISNKLKKQEDAGKSSTLYFELET